MPTKIIQKHSESSLSIAIPKELVRKEHLKEGEEVILEIKKSVL